jgi:hypothetical protein
MDNIDEIMRFCDSIVNNPVDIGLNPMIGLNLHGFNPKQIDDNMVQEPPSIKRLDIENLANFVQIWTDVLSIDDVNEQFQKSEFDDIASFETENYLYNVGFFYVKINAKLSVLEFFGLISKIPWESMRTPGMNQLSYISIAELFEKYPTSEEISIQLMVLGDFFKFWILINPFAQMSHTNETTKLFLSGMGTLSIYISPGFLGNCKDLIESNFL